MACLLGALLAGAAVASEVWAAQEPEPSRAEQGQPPSAQDAVSARIEPSPERLFDVAFKGHRDARVRWKERGYDALAVYTADFFRNVSGGISRGHEFLGNVDLLFDLDAERAFDWRGTSFFVYLLGNHGGDPSDRTGDAQVLDNMAAPSTVKLYELWGEVRLAPQFSVLAGLYDVSSEFDVIEASRDFVNSSFGTGPDFSQSGLNGPSIFPTTSLGVRAKFQPTLRSYLQTALVDGVSGDPDDASGTQIILDDADGVLFVVEGGWHLDPAEDHPPEARRLRARRIGRQQDWRHAAKIALGLWGYSERQLRIGADPDDPRRAHSRGAYLLGEARVLAEGGDPEQGLDLFGRVGVAETRVNRFGSSWIFGATYTGLFPGRDGDEIGLAIAAALNGGEYEAALAGAGVPVGDAETAIELTYVARIRPWLQLQPDLQYIVDPGTDPRLDDALALGLRLAITF